MLQSKLVHVQYSTDKAMTVYRSMVDATNKNTETINNTALTVNKIYTFRQRINNRTEKLKASEKRLGKKVVGLLDDAIHEIEKLNTDVRHYSEIMQRNTDSILITILKAIHYQWREKVYMSVLSRTNTIPVDDEFSCFLGWWYNSEGKARFSGFPPFIRLGAVHRRLHQVASELAKENLQAPDNEVILKKLEEFEAVSISVIMALDQLDEYLMKLAMSEHDSDC